MKEKIGNKLTILILFYIFLVVILVLIFGKDRVYAVDISGVNQLIELSDVEKLSVGIKQGDDHISLTDNVPYYTDKEVVFYPDTSSGDALFMEMRSAIVKEFCEKSRISESDLSFSMDSKSFTGYCLDGEEGIKEMTSDSISFSPSSEEHSEMAVKFIKRISLSLFYIDENGDERMAGSRERQYESDVYRLAFDKSHPLIRFEGIVNENGFYSTDSTIELIVEEAYSGIREIHIKSYGEALADVNLSERGRVVKYTNQIVLPVGKIEDGIGKITVYAISNLGYESTISINYHSDLNAPTIYLAGIDDGHIYSEKVGFKVNLSDNLKGNTLFYSVRYIDEGGNEKIIESFKEHFPGNNVEINREYDNEGVYEIVCYGIDDAGNVSDTINRSFGIDKTAPLINVSGINDGESVNGPVNLSVAVKELFYEGLRVDIRTIKIDGSSYTDIPIGSFGIGAVNNRNLYSFSGDGKYSVEIIASDASGNTSNSHISFSIDTSPPVIDFLFDGKEGDESALLDYFPSIEVKVREMNYQEMSLSANLIRKRTGNILETVPIGELRAESSDNVFSIPVSKEGIYELTVDAIDSVGNKASKKISFTIDSSPPAIGYLSDFNEKYLKSFNLPKNLESYISDATDVKYKAYLNSKETGPGEIKKDGKYILQVIAWDSLGNTNEEMIAFIIDNTKPSVIISGLNEAGEMKKDEAVTLSLYNSDDYFTEVYVNGQQKELSKDRKTCVFEPDGSEDYRIYLSAKDAANNVLIQTIETKSEPILTSPLVKTIEAGNFKSLSDESIKKVEKKSAKLSPLGIWILCGFICATAVILVTFAFVDSAKNPC